MSDSSEVLFHGNCADCGSTDACAAYDDGHTHCFSCGVTRQPKEIEHPMERAPEKQRRPMVAVDSTVPLAARRINTPTLKMWEYGIAKEGQRIFQVANYKDAKGKVVAQKIRHPDKTFEWRGDRKAALPLYGQWLWPPQGRRVIITEGEIDALSVSEAQGNRWPVVSVPDGAGSAQAAISKAADWLAGYQEVVLLFDMDEVGREAAAEAAGALRPGQALIARLPLKDASDMLKAGRADELVKATWQAVPYRPDGLVTGDAIFEHVRRPVPPSIPYPFPELHAVTGGLRKREITLLVAGSGAGKSTLARTVALALAERPEHKVGYVALEESVQRTALDVAGMRIGRNLRRSVYVEGDMTVLDQEDVAASLKWVSDRFVFYDHFGSLDPERLRDVIRHMILAEGCQFVVLDHISIVVSGGDQADERKAIDRIMTTTRQLVEETGVGMIVVSHLKRRQGGDKGFEEGAVPRLSDARGSGAIEQLSDTVIAGARDMTGTTPEEQALHLYVLKNRVMGTLGPAGTLIYDIDTGRMTPAEKEELEAMFPPADLETKDY